jgi:hypothetical protein
MKFLSCSSPPLPGSELPEKSGKLTAQPGLRMGNRGVLNVYRQPSPYLVEAMHVATRSSSCGKRTGSFQDVGRQSGFGLQVIEAT